MQRYAFIGIFFALMFAIIAVAATWSHDRAVQPAVYPDTTSTPNPGGSPK